MSVLRIEPEYSTAVLVTLAVALLGYAVRVYRLLKPPRIPGLPHIEDSSILGYTKLLGNKRLHFIALDTARRMNCAMHQSRLLGIRVVSVNDMNLAKQAFRDIVGKGGIFHAAFFRQGPRSIGSTFSLDTNDEWRMRRNKFRHPFSVSSVRSFESDVNSLVSKLCGIIGSAADASKPLQIDRLFGQLAMDAICRMAFTYELSALDDSAEFAKIHDALAKALELISLPILFPFIYYLRPFRFGVVKQFFDSTEYVLAFCRDLHAHLRDLERKGALPQDSLGAAIIDFSHMEGITDEHAVAEINLAFIAGHETTAHTLSFFVYALCKYPAIQLAAQQAMDAATGVDSTGLLPEYVEAVLKESMRKYPVAQGNIRIVQQEEGYDLGGVHLSKGDHVVMNSYVIQNLASNWGENVDEFLPERWLSDCSASDASSQANPLASAAVYAGTGLTKEAITFFPFSHGIRNCIGMNFALLEIRATIVMLLKNFSFRLVDPKMAEEDHALVRTLTMMPKDKLPVYATRRSGT